jgi:hypothetical protein
MLASIVQCIWFKHGDPDMKETSEVNMPSPAYTATLTHRPDGNVLLTLSMGKSLALRKVIDGDIVKSEQCVKALIHELVRDIKLASGDITWQGSESRWVKRELPTFTGNPLQLTAAKSLFSRRKIKD